MIFALKFKRHSEDKVTISVTRHVHKTDTNKAYVVSDMFGVTSDDLFEEGEKGNDDEDCCSICLTEKKAVCLLPCRHFCVCEECFQHIDKCPHCRQHYSTYLVIK